MLTPTERTWLLQEQAALEAAASKADLYARALVAYDDNPAASWARAWGVRRARKRLLRLCEVWTDQVYRREAVITSFINVYQTTRGPDSGPTYSQAHAGYRQTT